MKQSLLALARVASVVLLAIGASGLGFQTLTAQTERTEAAKAALQRRTP